MIKEDRRQLKLSDSLRPRNGGAPRGKRPARLFLFLGLLALALILQPVAAVQATALTQTGNTVRWVLDETTELERNLTLQYKHNGDYDQPDFTMGEAKVQEVFMANPWSMDEAQRQTFSELAKARGARSIAYDDAFYESPDFAPRADYNYGGLDLASALRHWAGSVLLGNFDALTDTAAEAPAEEAGGTEAPETQPFDTLELVLWLSPEERAQDVLANESWFDSVPLGVTLVSDQAGESTLGPIVALDDLQGTLETRHQTQVAVSFEPQTPLQAGDRWSLDLAGQGGESFGAFVTNSVGEEGRLISFPVPMEKRDEIGTAGSSMPYEPEVATAMGNLKNYLTNYGAATYSHDSTALEASVVPDSPFYYEMANYIPTAPATNLLSYELEPSQSEDGSVVIQSHELYLMDGDTPSFRTQDVTYTFQDGKLYGLTLN